MRDLHPWSPVRGNLAKLIQLPLSAFAIVEACRMTVCQADQLAMRRGTGKWRILRGPDEGGQAWAESVCAAVYIVEHRGVSGLGVSRTPRPLRTRPSKTLTADDNNFNVNAMLRLSRHLGDQV